MSTPAEVIVGIVIGVGLVGIVLPVVPGALLVWGAIAFWAVQVQSTSGWLVLGLATAAIGITQIVKYVVPERRLRDAGVPRRSVLIGAGLGLVGFFVIPVVGLVLGFIGGIYVAERQRLETHEDAWRSTLVALRLVGLAILIELFGAVVAAVSWLGVVLAI